MENKILTEKQHNSRLDKYYKQHYGERDTDEWFVNPAVNAWRFVRNGQLITLKSHMITGEVTEIVRPYIKDGD